MIDDFDFLYIIGKGGYGKVWKVRDKFTGNCYALKQMTKAKIIAEGSEMSILRERIFLAKMHSPFIVNMFLAFQNMLFHFYQRQERMILFPKCISYIVCSSKSTLFANPII